MKRLEKVLQEGGMRVDMAVREIWKVALPVLRLYGTMTTGEMKAVADGVAEKIKELI